MQYVDCDRAEKHGSLCLGYGYEEIDEPCEQCSNCIKCESGSYQLGETEKDDQLIKAKDLLLRFIDLKNKPCAVGHSINMLLYENISAQTEQFLKGENIILEDAQAGNTPFDADEVFNKEMKAYTEEK